MLTEKSYPIILIIMNLPIFYGLLAGAFWGLSFGLPHFAAHIPFIWIMLGRYLMFGASSACALWFQKKDILLDKKFILLSLLGYSLYYTSLVFSIQKIGVTIPSLIIGLLPLTTFIWGREKKIKELKLKDMWLPLLLLSSGMICIQIDSLAFESFSLLGLLCSFLSLCLWTCYSILNSRWIKSSPQISAAEWTSNTGLAAMITAIGITLLYFIFTQTNPVSHFLEYLWNQKNIVRWLYISITLGVLCSWIAIFLWNKASQKLSAQMTGQLIVSETVFGVLYGLIIDWRQPRPWELASVLFCVSGITIAIRKMSR